MVSRNNFSSLGGQSIDCSPQRYEIVCDTNYESANGKQHDVRIVGTAIELFVIPTTNRQMTNKTRHSWLPEFQGVFFELSIFNNMAM